jgi:hypothetical protein
MVVFLLSGLLVMAAGCMPPPPPPPTGAGGMDLPGTSGSYAGSPDSPQLSVTGDIDIRAYVAPDDWTPAADQVLVGKWNTTGAERSWAFQLVGSTGDLKLTWSPDGTAVRTASSAGAPPGVVDGQPQWVRVTVDEDNGSGLRVTNFYASADGSSWTQFGQDTGTNLSPFQDSTSQVEIGSYNNGASFNFAGIVYRVEIRNGIDGTAVATPDFRTDPSDTSQRQFTDTQGNVWSLMGDATLLAPT